MPEHRAMKINLVTLPGLYADWTAIGWSMLLGKPPTGAGMEPTVSPAQIAAKHEQPKQGASPKQPKKAKPAARKAKSKSAAKRALKSKARSAATARKRRAAAKRR
jgi:hypothetical protein